VGRELAPTKFVSKVEARALSEGQFAVKCQTNLIYTITPERPLTAVKRIAGCRFLPSHTRESC
jgi:hypothetical protein